MPHRQALAALVEGERDLLLPAEVDGWVVVSLLSDSALPPTLAALRQTDGEHASPAGRPRRTPSPDLEAQQRAFAGRHPDTDLEALARQVAELATRSLASRCPGAEPDPLLLDQLAPRMRSLHAFWRAAAARMELPELELSEADSFRPALCRASAVRPVRVALDPWCELLDFAVEVQGPASSRPGAGTHRHLELWTLAHQVGTDEPWRVVDLSWAPPALP